MLHSIPCDKGTYPFSACKLECKDTLVLCIDVGTVYSGVAFAHLNPGKVPQIRPVVHRLRGGSTYDDFRIPTVVCYRPDGSVLECGAEAEVLSDDVDSGLVDFTDDGTSIEGLSFVRSFKLHLLPETFDVSGIVRRDLPSLPCGKSVVQVLADFLRYLFTLSLEYAMENTPECCNPWAQEGRDIEIVLTHPNGCEGPQQAKMRDAAVLAGMVPDSDAGHARIHFVSEGEASFQACVLNGHVSDMGEDDNGHGGVMILDAGGGTVNISSYAFTSKEPLCASEIAPSSCVLEGSTIVTRRAKQFLKERFGDTEYGQEEDLQAMAKDFDTNVKTRFKPSFSRVTRVNHRLHTLDDTNLKLKRGYPILTLEEMQSFFSPVLTTLITEIHTQIQKASSGISVVFLLGGFSFNDWLFENLKETLQQLFGLTLFRPASFGGKEVSCGGVSFFVQSLVTQRISKKTYGLPTAVCYSPSLPDHIERRRQIVHTPQGPMIPGGLASFLTKGHGKEVSEGFYRIIQGYDQCPLDYPVEIIGYNGEDTTNTLWLDVNPELFERAFVVDGDLSKVPAETCCDGEVSYLTKRFNVIFKFGTELQAQIQWEEDGMEKRCRAQIIYD